MVRDSMSLPDLWSLCCTRLPSQGLEMGLWSERKLKITVEVRERVDLIKACLYGKAKFLFRQSKFTCCNHTFVTDLHPRTY